MAFGEHGLGLAGIACPLVNGPRSFGKHGVVAVPDQLFFCFVKYGKPG
jgi:hypothetical protein